jgi:death-on-curing protein
MTRDANTCVHLTTDIVREIHQVALTNFGGLDGVRDAALLESAVAAPQATLGGASVFDGLVEIAAAYLFYLCRNHPFLDGNKRTALGACLVFLRLNALEPAPDGPEWEALVLAVASGTLSREAATSRLRSLVPEQSA